jgi:hypothetical protein
MSDITPIGVTTWRNQAQPFGIAERDRFGHIYCLGKTGSGKSTLLLNMAIADIQAGKGVAVIDPHGDLAEQLLDYIPEHRINDAIYFNAGDSDQIVAFNPLYNIQEQDRYIVAATIVTTLKKLWADSWGPRLEHILRNTLISLSYYSKATLLDIAPMLTNYHFRKQVLYALPVQSIKDFWEKEFEPLSPQLKQEFIAPILNKVGILSTHPILRNIFGQQVSAINIAEIMNTRKILIINVSKGVLGETAAQVLGALFVTQFQTAALGRATRPISSRTPFHLYIDEVHSFITQSFADILSESRKYALSLFITHQFIEQIPEDIRTAVLGNVGTLIVFRIGSRDAQLLEEEFFPVCTAADLISLPRYHIYIKLLIDGATSQPFSAVTHPLSTRRQLTRQLVLDTSQRLYAKPRVAVEEQLQNTRECEPSGLVQQTLL